ncbi:MAG TPA: sulfotransferase [Kofleriaceae bacterium]|jgi:hypothetical protein
MEPTLSRSTASATTNYLPALIFVIGVARRSGTNYLARAIVSHPDVCRPRGHWELPFLEIADQFRDMHRSFVALRGPDRLDFTFAEFASYMGRGLVDGIARRVTVEEQAPFVLHKNPGTGGLEHFRDFFPDSHLILLIRDGRDNLCSMLAAHGKLGRGRRLFNLIRDARLWATSAERIRDHLQRDSNCTLVRYEEMNAQPRKVLAEIAERIGLRADQRWLDSSSTIPVFGSGFLRTSAESNGHLVEEPGPTQWVERDRTEAFQPVGRWHKQLSRTEQKLVHRIIGPMLSEFGYTT